MATAKKNIPLVLMALACIPAWGQAGKNAPPNIPQVYDKPGVTAAGNEPMAQAIDPRTYLIGPEDILKIEVFRDADLSRMVNVRPDGKITMALVGDLQAEGLTPERLTVQLKEALSQYITSPEVTISVMAVNSKSFVVTGKVNRSGKFPLITPIRVFDALGLTGGFQDFADTKNITIVRGAQRLTFNYKDFVKGKKEALDQNILIQNGDTILVK
ncbi:MAG: polysaccharide export protein [Acidobacteriia bacterium]|nr:polysaccharide export protein [Terriglobia bacterium]